MTAGELIDALHRAGGTLSVVDGKPRLQGAQIPAALKASLKANRDEARCQAALQALEDGARGNGNLLALCIDAARARAAPRDRDVALGRRYGGEVSHSDDAPGC